MKVNWGISLIILSVIIILIYIFGGSILNYFSLKNKIKISLPKDSVILVKYDSHGGPHGDGEYYSEIQLSEKGLQKFLKNSNKTGKWFSYPLPEDIQKLMYGSQYETESYKIGTKSINIPRNIKNGIYYIRDRFAERYPNEKDTNILSRHSYNVTISILDIDTKKLYIYELDT